MLIFVSEFLSVKLAINVEIHSSIERDPNRVLLGRRAECEEGALDLIPIRPGCLRHLGVSRGFAEDGPPPPYC